MRIIASQWYQLELISIGSNPAGVTTLSLDFLRFFRLKPKMGHNMGHNMGHLITGVCSHNVAY